MGTAEAAPSASVPAPPARDLSHVLRIAWRGVVILVAVVALVIAAVRIRGARSETPVRYETTAVDRGPIAAKVTATGALSALVTVSVGSQVSGRIATLGADFGSKVKKGQVVATIDPALFKAAVAQANANYQAARAALVRAEAQRQLAHQQLARTQGLFAQTLASRQDLDTAQAAVGVGDADVVAAEATVAQTEAALGQARLNLSYCTIVSPIEGVVISRNVDVGQTVAATLQAPTLFTIAQDLTKMQVDTNVAEADVGKIRAGMPVTFTVDAYPTRSFAGTVRQVRDNAQTIQNVVTYDAVIDVDNRERLLKPSMTASVTFVYATRDAALRLPNAAIRFKPDATTITAMTGAPPKPAESRAADERIAWVLRGGRAQPVVVRIGISDGTTTEVIGGDVRDGDLAITEANVDAAAKRGG